MANSGHCAKRPMKLKNHHKRLHQTTELLQEFHVPWKLSDLPGRSCPLWSGLPQLSSASASRNEKRRKDLNKVWQSDSADDKVQYIVFREMPMMGLTLLFCVLFRSLLFSSALPWCGRSSCVALWVLAASNADALVWYAVVFGGVVFGGAWRGLL